MKLRKGIITTLIVFLFLTIAGMFSNVNAASSKWLNIRLLRSSGYGYKVASSKITTTPTKNVWKIVTTNAGGSTWDYDSTIYCLRAGPGFGSTDFINSGSPEPTEYTRYFDMKNTSSINNADSKYKSAIPSTSSNEYKAILWILDNCYVAPKENASNQEKQRAEENRKMLVAAAAEYADEIGDVNTTEYELDMLTPDDIDAVQQLAIWHFTNPGSDFDVGQNFEFYLNTIRGTDGTYKPLSERKNFDEDVFDNGWDRQYASQTLYKYLVNTAKEQAPSYSINSANTSAPVELVKTTTPEVNAIGSRFVIGPYKLNEVRNIDYTLTGTWEDENGRTITDVRFVNQNGTSLSSSTTLKSLAKSKANFYISIPNTTSASNVKFKISGTYFTTRMNYWSVENPGDRDQPVVIVEKGDLPFEDEIDAQYVQRDGKYELIIKKQDSKNTAQNLPGAKFEVTLPNGTKEEHITNADGEIKISNLPITVEGSQTIIVKETEAPDGYSKEEGVESYKIIVDTILDNGKYVVDTTNLQIQPQNVQSNATLLMEGSTNGTSTTLTLNIPNKKAEGEYELELVKIDGLKESTKLQGAEFEVTLPNGTKQKCTTNANGSILINHLQITSAGQETITIKETKAPQGYVLNSETITLNITTAKENGNYVVKSVKIADKTLTNNEQAVNVGKTNLIAKANSNKIYIEMKNYYFDLALRKFITQIDGSAPAISREPKHTVTKLNNGEKTADKPHTKNPLPVKNGSTVVYTIRVYNEGTIDGYATQITDYLPAGLKLKANSTINSDNGWSNPSGDGKTIVTHKLNNQLLKAFDGNRIDYKDLQIECEVIANDNNTSLKNVAEITSHKDKDGNTDIKDRDSTPNNLSNTQKENYNPGTSEKGWGYEDDDDYENLSLVKGYFDLALRKFITAIEGVAPTVDREPKDTVVRLNNGEKTADKPHTKSPLPVKKGQTVLYTIRIYNEGEVDGYATQITDYLPAGLKLKENSTVNTENGWTNPSGDGKTIVTDKLAGQLIKAFNGTTIDHKDVQVECEVIAEDNSKSLKNVAEITAHKDKDGNTNVIDRDSTPNNLTKEQKENYNPGTSEKGWGYEDDDDYEDLKLVQEYFDLALRKYITNINGKDLKDSKGRFLREPNVDVTDLLNGTKTTANYNHTKEPIGVANGDIVIYTIRVYNEGNLDAYVPEITDHLPPQLEFIVDDELNAKYGWKVSADGRTVSTDVTSPRTENYASRDEIYKDRKTGTDKVILDAFKDRITLDYIDVQIKCRVKAQTEMYQKITNIAQITKYSYVSEDGTITNSQVDRDSEEKNVVLPTDERLPEYKDPEIESGILYIEGQQDDDDFEKLVLQKFDLALRKFITGVNETEINNRVPVFVKGENGAHKYEHTKEPVEVENGNIVTYTLRIFNEGNMAGYASEIKDNLPEGLEYLPENDLNKTYRWKMFKEDGTETQNVKEAVSIRTDYLSKEQETEEGSNLLKAYNPDTMTMPDYKDVKIAFKVTEPNTSDRILINTAEISKDTDEDGNPVDDVDSTPDNDKDGEDDIDIEKVKVKYFDLSLKKWVTESIVTYNGKTTVTKTGHTGNENPEAPAKVEIRGSRVSKTTVKFKFNIKVTNEGEIAGYAKELIDYIPAGLKFVQKDNPKWKQVDGKVVTDQLKDKLLQPGQSATVEIILTWTGGKNNMGLKTNWAEISKDSNPSNTPDIDSTPGNNVKGEDDIDEAPVILSIVTGSTVMAYVGLMLGVLVILSSGIVVIKKFVL